MTPTTTPDLPLPGRAAFVHEWQPGPPPHRVILGAPHVFGPAEVQIAVIQLADGTIDGYGPSDESTEPRAAVIQPPSVHVRVDGDKALTVDQALGLSTAIVQAVLEIGKWRT
jgi:hypothetical protein